MNVWKSVQRLSLSAKLVIVLVVVALLAWSVSTIWETVHSSRATIWFSNTTGLYVGDPVKVRGVSIGTVSSIEPTPTQVKVEVSYDDSIFVSNATQAVIVAPTLVSGRYVQFVNPTSGPATALADGAVIGRDRTAVPVSYDEIKNQVTDLAGQLGPQGGDRGALSDFVDASATRLRGNGNSLASALTSLSDAMSTLSRGGPDLFATVRNLQTVVTALRNSDDQIVSFSQQLDAASGLLDDNKTQLDAALRAVDAMAPQLQSYLSTNRTALNTNVKELIRISTLLVDREDDLAQILHTTPTALTDLYNIYDPNSNSLTGALALPDLPDPASLICALLTTVNAPQQQCQRSSRTFSQLFSSLAAQQTARSVSTGTTSGSQTNPTVGLPTNLADLLRPGGGR